MSESKNDVVLCEIQGGVATLTLNRPDVRNAIDLSVVTRLTTLLRELAPREDVGTLILTGAGDKAFASGADIAQLLVRTRDDAFRGINTTLFKQLEDFPRPTIAAVRGYCLGGGMELAMACDIRLAGRSAHFGQPEVSLGIMAAAGGTYRLARLVGLGKAKELLFTGDIIDAEEARRIGLVNRVVDDEGVVAAARAMATRIVSLDPLAVRVTKLSVNALARGETAQTVETLAQAILFESPGKRERMTAFLSKKKK